ncbi:heavy metal-associated domain protein [Streptococcus ictaluri 707-05]|uniref:Heavy metal-associated domain protein n=1 Tax=Streptococcus ictaluri 707-05 TaxID=764299 RepID=G5K479_9STRE|nr:heavy metal-associated domain protein [Streptococcus ictaluri 707-05]
MKKEQFSLKGMTCASCALTIEKAVKQLPSVDQAVVNLATEKMTVSFKGQEKETESVLQAVAKAGYQADVLDTQTSKTLQDSQEEETQGIWRRFLWSALFTLPLFYLAMGHILGLWLPSFLHPEHHPLRYAVIQFLLTCPVLYFSRAYF